MRSDLPKVVFPIGGRPMVCAVVDACRAAGCKRIVAIVGYKQNLVREALAGYPDVEFAVQEEQLGTGHAVTCAASLFTNFTGDVLVLCGDGPLIREATIRTMLRTHRDSAAAATLATSVIQDPTGYGRIARNPDGSFRAIVEHKNCTPAEREIREVNPSYYCFRSHDLFAALKSVTRNPVSGEYYLTDVPELLLKQGRSVEIIEAVPPEDVLSINTPEDLANVDAVFKGRSRSGAAAQSPASGG